jgi:hypothetical protein
VTAASQLNDMLIQSNFDRVHVSAVSSGSQMRPRLTRGLVVGHLLPWHARAAVGMVQEVRS